MTCFVRDESEHNDRDWKLSATMSTMTCQPHEDGDDAKITHLGVKVFCHSV